MKRYQVFVSSTYEDLKVERSEVFHGLLDIGCIPCGMEYFPASSESQWDYIRRIIDDCDYYIVISAGKYGSLAPDGIGYTQKEYEYALEKGIPTIAFLHGNLGSLLASQSETTTKRKRKLDAFRTALQGGRMCKFWTTPLELRAVITVSLTAEKQHNPRTGWVRADATNEETTKEMLGLYKENKELKSRLADLDPDADTTQYAQGRDDTYAISYRVSYVDRRGRTREEESNTIVLSWDTIIYALLPHYVERNRWITDADRISTCIRPYIQKLPDIERIEDINVHSKDVETILCQLVALRYLELRGGITSLTHRGEMKFAHSRAVLRDSMYTTDAPTKTGDSELS
ncbi:MAG: DUF4062 domain-containing protein ['Candidatus Kapabacteria' thiocyanatum]|uniref:DUF4062 domain-containing protein n=1 Tax=Candidatus Kapaibacterium thiocyanatum TaxID=1895771 RepID=A0A1M3KYY4_9BACT|nr:DUF4062 domain-containing protein ['Candidatus Kapabacteria' thiocyanatum]OJX57728.1 MAG: hypothetical protein BGO89_07080 ['Candidatus Kapabacteria' thiocyanatum]